jgi:hypothetical protein
VGLFDLAGDLLGVAVGFDGRLAFDGGGFGGVAEVAEGSRG